MPRLRDVELRQFSALASREIAGVGVSKGPVASLSDSGVAEWKRLRLATAEELVV